jgi:multicomponent Na+:H+ antiporter subunit F
VTAFLFVVTLLVTLFILVAIYRIAKGPTVYDRVVASALAAVNGVIVLLLVSFLFGRVEMFVDIAISYALLAFLLPIGVGKYFEHRGRE